ncbi:MAG: TolC family protein [Flammeovirgaceae bacterium]
MNRIYFLIIIPILCLQQPICWAQQVITLDLNSCLEKAEANYPLIKQYGLLEKTLDYQLENTEKGKLPRINISGQLTHQSEVTSLPSGGTDFNVPTISKTQYRLYGEITQPLTDIMLINHQKKLVQKSKDLSEKSLEVQLYRIKEQVSQLFFNLLLFQNQLEQNALTKQDLEIGLARIEASIKYGTALKSNADVLNAEIARIEQREIELLSSKEAMLKMLEHWIGEELSEQTTLTAPVFLEQEYTNQRLELSLYDAQIAYQALESERIDLDNLPKFSLFLQTGAGQPALNLLNNELEPYYLGGLRLSWNISNFYTSNKKKKLYALNQSMILSEKETFQFNTDLQLSQQQVEIAKIKKLIEKDKQIILLRERITETAKNQLENGVITSTNYKELVIDADQARQNLALHQIELLVAQNNYQFTSGNLK